MEGFKMTVVANPLIEDVPVLIGDTVITSSDPSEISINVPTVLSLPSLRRPITAFRRKVYIIEKRLAVAWTGSRLNAERLISDLRQHFKKQRVSESELERFLSDYKFLISNGSKVILLGWIAEREPRPFWWSTEYPNEIHYDEHDVEGSGRDIFLTTFFSDGVAVRGPGLTAEEHVFLRCLSGISRLLAIETEQSLSLINGFGFCYDIVIWSKYRFRYIDSYTQVSFSVRYNSTAESGQTALQNPIFIYKSLGHSAALSVMRVGDDQNPDQSHDLAGVDPIIIRSVAHQGGVDAPRPKFRSKYTCAVLSIIDEKGLSLTAPFCITDEAKPADGMWFSQRGRVEILELDTKVIKMIHSEASRKLSIDR
jgi:hypothetical protein